MSRAVPTDVAGRGASEATWVTPSWPVATQVTLVCADPPPAQRSKPGSAERLHVPPPSRLTATTVPAGFSNQLATSCRGSPGSTASDGSAGRADGDSPAQAAATDTGPLMMRGGGKLRSFGGALR